MFAAGVAGFGDDCAVLLLESITLIFCSQVELAEESASFTAVTFTVYSPAFMPLGSLSENLSISGLSFVLSVAGTSPS